MSDDMNSTPLNPSLDEWIARADYETKAAQTADEIERLKAHWWKCSIAMVPTCRTERADEPIRLLKAVRVAAQEATFAETRSILCLVGIHVLYNGQMLETSGGVAVQAVDRDKLLKYGLTGGNSSRPPQSSPSADSPVAGTGTTSGRCMRSTDRMLRFYKSSLRFSVAISLENLRKFRET